MSDQQPPPTVTDRITLLIVDDDRPFRVALGEAFTRRGYEVRTAGSADEALALCDAFAPERAILDLRMVGASGLDLLRELRHREPALVVVILTGYGSIPTAIEAVKRGAANYLTKPADPDEIEAAFGRETAPDPAIHAHAHAAPPAVPSLDRASWEHIQRVLGDCQGNVSEAARRLGMHRRSLQRKLQKHPPRR